MRKLVTSVVFFFFITGNIHAQFSNPAIQLRSMSVDVKANSLSARTDIEMVFFNSGDRVAEAVYEFSLVKEQLITGFTLDIGSIQREGVITEKNKAAATYQAIVSGRVDPGLLEQTADNKYRLRVYPVNPNATRKITFRIDQLLTAEKNKLLYNLPLVVPGTVEDYDLKINIDGGNVNASAEPGIIDGLLFQNKESGQRLLYQQKKFRVQQPLSFSIPISDNKVITWTEADCANRRFVSLINTNFPPVTAPAINTATIFWDVSGSSVNRDINKDVELLEQYLFGKNLSSVTLVVFSNTVQQVKTITIDNFALKAIKTFLRSQPGDGAARLENLDCKKYPADEYLLFSSADGNYNGDRMKLTDRPVHCINSTGEGNTALLKKITAESGGHYIDLKAIDIPAALTLLNDPVIKLMSVEHGKTVTGLNVHVLNDQKILLSGITMTTPDTVTIRFGTNGKFLADRTIITGENNTVTPAHFFTQVALLTAFDKLGYTSKLSSQVLQNFAAQFPLVTNATSFLVLETLTDYMRYGISIPPDLSKQHDQQSWVIEQKKRLEQSKKDRAVINIRTLVPTYNERLYWWDKNATLLNAASFDIKTKEQRNVAGVDGDDAGRKNITGASAMISSPVILERPMETREALQEVVVTSAFQTKRPIRSVSANAQVISGDQLNTVRQTNINNALAGKVAGIQVRSQSIAVLDASTALRLRGENSLSSSSAPLYVVNGTIIPSPNDIVTDDIEDVTVLQGPSAAALFGVQGQNGAIVITMKKGKQTYGATYDMYRAISYNKLEEMDYVKELKFAAHAKQYDVYLEMKDDHADDPAFYFDVAEQLHRIGRQEEAFRVLTNLMVIGSENADLLRAVGYILEDWKMYDEAIMVYERAIKLSPDKTELKRDLALAHYNNGDYQMAVDQLYSIISLMNDEYYYTADRAAMLNEMNAIIELHKDKLDISAINPSIIRPLPVDLRILVEHNKKSTSVNTLILEPGGVECSAARPVTKNGGKLFGQYQYWNGFSEYEIKNAVSGQYKIQVDHFDHYDQGKTPSLIRVSVFKNFGQPNQSFSTHCYMMDNQAGRYELETVQF